MIGHCDRAAYVKIAIDSGWSNDDANKWADERVAGDKEWASMSPEELKARRQQRLGATGTLPYAREMPYDGLVGDPTMTDILVAIDHVVNVSGDPAASVTLVGITEWLLSRMDSKDIDKMRAVILTRVSALAAQAVADGVAAWVPMHHENRNDPKMRYAVYNEAIRRKIDLVAYADMALAMGEDPEAAVEKVTGIQARYRHGPCYFTRLRGDTKHDIARVMSCWYTNECLNDDGPRAPHFLALWEAIPGGADGWQYPFTYDGVQIACHADLKVTSCALVPEHYARRVEQAGWTPLYMDMPPHWLDAELAKKLAYAT